MLFALPTFNVVTLLVMALLSSFVYFVGYLLNTEGTISSRKNRKVLSFLGISVVVIILSFFKYRFFQNIVYAQVLGHPSRYIFLIGISYSSFKMMHFIIESYKQKIERMTLLNFLNFIFFFPAFISGPINRYNHFCKQLEVSGEKGLGKDLSSGTERIIHGLFKKIVLCTVLYPYTFMSMQTSITELNASQIIIGLYAYALYFYFDFGGYSDIAIGSARIMGIQLPENFNYPFLKRNIQQLWASWHMSLTTWLTDYIYWPLVRKLRKRELFRKRFLLLSNMSIFITFVICGMWHGEGANYVIWGGYHGLGLATLNVYQRQKRKISNKAFRKYLSSRYSEWTGIALTFHFFVLGLIFFAFDVEQLRALFFKLLG